jgi:quinoprotein glucose dehydrogenase
MSFKVAVGALLCGILLFAQQAAQNHRTWADYLGGNDSSHYSSLDQINRSNVAQLEVAWQYDTGDRTSYGVNPLVVGNLIYVIAKNNSVVALNAATGQEVWTYDSGEHNGRHRGLNYWESKDHSDRRLLMTYGDKLQAINATTGQLIDSFGDHGSVNLKEGLDVDPAIVTRIQSGTPGRVFENLIILGSSTGEAYVSPPGHLRAYNVITGKREWIFHTIPHPGEFGYDTWPKDAWKYIGGTNTWGEITIDEQRGIAYFPLGSPTYDFYGADRKGAGLFGDCLLALDARTGKYLWHYQLVHHDLWDYDAVAAPQLITVHHDGKDIDAVAQAGKQGFLYVFDRVTGKPIWPIEEKPVPRSDMPGEAAWPTQPFPTAPPPFARQKFTADDIDPFILTPEQRATWKDRISSARNEGIYTPPGFRETVEMPGNNGGGNFWGTATDRATGTVYVVSKEVPALLKMLESPPGNGSGNAANANLSTAQRGRLVFDANCRICHGADAKGEGVAPSLVGVLERRGTDDTKKFIARGEGEMPSFALNEKSMADLLNFLSDPAAVPKAPAAASGSGGRPARAEVPYPTGVEVPPVRYYTGYGLEPRVIGPPWSQLTAYDLNTGTIKWQIPYGDAAEAGPSDKPRGTIFERSGIAVTAGGLIFFAGNDPVMHILDKDTGKELRSIKLPNGVQGVPVVYEVDGREYVAFCATGGDDVGSSQRGFPHVYIAFALPQSMLDQKK